MEIKDRRLQSSLNIFIKPAADRIRHARRFPFVRNGIDVRVALKQVDFRVEKVLVNSYFCGIFAIFCITIEIQPRNVYFSSRYQYSNNFLERNIDAFELQVIKIYGDKDEDDFYYGETRGGQRGFVPSNMVMELSYHNANVSPRNDSSRLRDRASISSLRKMVALFDYDPIKTSPNPDAEVS